MRQQIGFRVSAILRKMAFYALFFLSGASVHAGSAIASNAACSPYQAILKTETSKSALPFDVAAAVMKIESSCDPHKIGGVGEIGLMQVRPATAAMLGFSGSLDQLAEPETNIRLGVAYLAGAWRLANADLCRALMKYRAGHGEDIMTPRSIAYCNRAREQMGVTGPSMISSGPLIATSVRERPLDRQGCIAAIAPLNIMLRGHAFVSNQIAHVKAIRRCISLPPRLLVSRR